MSNIEILDAENVSKITDSYAMRTVEVMSQWGNGEIYDERIIIERGRIAMQQAMLGAFEFGRALIILKELTEYGRFTEIVETQFNITIRSAQNYMTATRRFANDELKRVREKFLNIGHSKLLVLLSEFTDEEMSHLADGGELSGKSLDEIDRMTRNELRTALKASREETEDARKVSEQKNKKIDELHEKLERTRRQIANADPEAVGEELRLSLSAVQVSIESEMTKLRPLLDQLTEHGQVNGIDHAPTIVGCLNQIIRNCEYLRESYHLPQESPTDEVPAWVKAMQDEGKVN